MALEVGSRLGHYDVTARIGEGGMGQVYQATDTKLKSASSLDTGPGSPTGGPFKPSAETRERTTTWLHHGDGFY